MNLTANKLSFAFHRLLLLVLYAVFFLVQFSCITGADNTSVAIAPLSYHKEITKEKVFAAKDDHSKKSKIRLNKRFQPANADGIISPVVELPVKYINGECQSKPQDHLLISFILATSLRGPPSLS